LNVNSGTSLGCASIGQVAMRRASMLANELLLQLDSLLQLKPSPALPHIKLQYEKHSRALISGASLFEALQIIVPSIVCDEIRFNFISVIRKLLM